MTLYSQSSLTLAPPSFQDMKEAARNHTVIGPVRDYYNSKLPLHCEMWSLSDDVSGDGNELSQYLSLAGMLQHPGQYRGFVWGTHDIAKYVRNRLAWPNAHFHCEKIENGPEMFGTSPYRSKIGVVFADYCKAWEANRKGLLQLLAGIERLGDFPIVIVNLCERARRPYPYSTPEGIIADVDNIAGWRLYAPPCNNRDGKIGNRHYYSSHDGLFYRYDGGSQKGPVKMKTFWLVRDES